MATIASQKRMERRRLQRLRTWYINLPEYQAMLREIKAWQRYRRRRRFTGQPTLAWMHCTYMGITKGGRAAGDRRCTKRLGSKVCHNWREAGRDRCYRHRREPEA